MWFIFDLSNCGSLNKCPFISETTVGVTSLCPPQFTYWGKGKAELQLPMTSPIQLDFTVNTVLYIFVMFSPNGPGTDEALCPPRKNMIPQPEMALGKYCHEIHVDNALSHACLV